MIPREVMSQSVLNISGGRSLRFGHRDGLRFYLLRDSRGRQRQLTPDVFTRIYSAEIARATAELVKRVDKAAMKALRPITREFRAAILTRETAPARRRRRVGLLDLCALLCRGETRTVLEAAAHDVRREVRELRAAGVSRCRILGVRFRMTATSLLPVLRDWAKRTAVAARDALAIRDLCRWLF